jgi:hypothetical protein
MSYDATYYRHAFPAPLPYERGLYNLGFNPFHCGERHYKALDAAGLAKLFAEFEKLYDSNYQAYMWLYHTGYGKKVYDTLRDVLERDHGGANLLDRVCDAIVTAKNSL